MNLQKYWGCKEQCSEQQKQEQCGKSGYYFYNQCHMQCYGKVLSSKMLSIKNVIFKLMVLLFVLAGDNPGQPGKDCDN